MATYSPKISEKGPTPIQDDEVLSLRPVLDLFFGWWREIFLLTLLAAAIGVGVSLYYKSQSTPLYEATSQVAIARIVSNVKIDSTIQTSMSNGDGAAESIARRASLLGLVKNGTVANQVLEELGPMLEGMTATSMMSLVNADYTGESVSDLIEIKVLASSPEKATAIANSWAKHYVDLINGLYGEMPTEMTDVVTAELDNAKATYEAAQQAYETFLTKNEIQTLTRQIGEKQQVISLLQQGRLSGLNNVISQTLDYRQQLITTYLNTIQQNRMLAFSGEQDANRSLIQTFIQAISDNRQLAFATEHKARVAIFNQYADVELQNRLLAMQQEQDAKAQIFKAYSDADLKAKLTTFNQQVDQKVGTLISLYAAQRSVQALLGQATDLQQQVEQAGESGAQSNALPILLLKLESYASSALNDVGTTNLLQFNVDNNNALVTDLESQKSDLATLISILTERASEIDQQLEIQAQALQNNEGYKLLDKVRPEDDALYAAIQEQYLALFDVDTLGQTGDSAATNGSLSQAILNKYDELFGVGNLTSASLAITDTTPIYTALQSQYPSLFSIGNLAQLGDVLAQDSALDTVSQQKLVELLQPVQELDNYIAAADTVAQPIQQLETEVGTLQANLEHQQAESNRLAHERDLAQEAYDALKNKLLEFTLQRTTAGRELRVAAAAVQPDFPISRSSWLLTSLLCAFIGFALAVIIAALSNYVDAEPFLSRLRPSRHKLSDKPSGAD